MFDIYFCTLWGKWTFELVCCLCNMCTQGSAEIGCPAVFLKEVAQSVWVFYIFYIHIIFCFWCYTPFRDGCQAVVTLELLSTKWKFQSFFDFFVTASGLPTCVMLQLEATKVKQKLTGFVSCQGGHTVYLIPTCCHFTCFANGLCKIEWFLVSVEFIHILLQILILTCWPGGPLGSQVSDGLVWQQTDNVKLSLKCFCHFNWARLMLHGPLKVDHLYNVPNRRIGKFCKQKSLSSGAWHFVSPQKEYWSITVGIKCKGLKKKRETHWHGLFCKKKKEKKRKTFESGKNLAVSVDILCLPSVRLVSWKCLAPVWQVSDRNQPLSGHYW